MSHHLTKGQFGSAALAFFRCAKGLAQGETLADNGSLTAV
jgi:hypothetical protein